MEYPITGKISSGAFHATSEDDLVALYEYLLTQYGLETALELGDLYPEVFVKTYNLVLDQNQIDQLYLVLGHSVSPVLRSVETLLDSCVSPDQVDAYDRVNFSYNSDDGFTIRVD